jgi:hypothetical protein
MAKKPAKETSLPVVVSLVFFVLLSIGLGVFAYVTFSDQEAKDAEVTKAKDEVKGLRAAAKEAELIARAQRVFLGVPEADDLQVIQQEVKENDKVHQEIKKLSDAVGKKLPELTKATTTQFNAAVKAYLDTPDREKALLPVPAVAPGEFKVWSGEFDGAQLKAPTVTALDLVARSGVSRHLALTQAAADRAAYDSAVATIGKASEAYKTARDTFAAKATSLPEDFKKKMDALGTELNTRVKSFEDAVAVNRKDLDGKSKEIEDLQTMKRALERDIEALKEQLVVIKGKIKPPDPLQYDEPQGKIVRRLPNNLVEINVGSDMLVNPGLTFSVLPLDFPEKGRQSRLREFRVADERGNFSSKVEFVPKGTVEVIEVLGPSLSRARITGEHDQIADSVLAGDLLYNSAWRRGVGEHIALLGVFDTNGDGTDDIEAVVRDLTKMGITVDAAFDMRKQEWRGRLTERTRYVVEGHPVPVSANDPHQAQKAVLIGKMGAARNEARDRAIQIVNFRDFFGRIGYRVNPSVTEDRIRQAVTRYFAGAGPDPMPMTPKN